VTALEGSPDEAVAGFADALRRHEAIEWRFVKALVALDFVALLGPDEPTALATAGKARETFASVRTEPLLRRLNAVSAREVAPIAPRASPAGARPAPTSETVGERTG
jgi:hypothetical protein